MSKRERSIGRKYSPHCNLANVLALFITAVALTVFTANTNAAALSCESLALDPVSVEGDRVLQRYYERNTEGVGGLGCWVHPHPNGQDFVLTPYSWGREPDAGVQRRIDDAFQAITDSHAQLETLGTLDIPLYVLMNDIMGEDGRAPAEAEWFIDGQCWIEAGPSTRFRGGDPASRDHAKSVLAHEIGHCFLMENIPGYSPANYGASNWWDESGAEFYMALVYPQANVEHESSFLFDLDGRDFLQAYNAVVLLQHYANLNGNAAILPLLTQFHQHSMSEQQFFDFLHTSALDEFYDDFGVTHFNSSVTDPGGSTMPAEFDVIPFETVRLSREEEDIVVSTIAPRQVNVMLMSVPAGYDAVLYSPDRDDDLFLATVSDNGLVKRDWTKGIEIPGLCHDETLVNLLLTSLRRDGARDRSIRYRRTQSTACECEDSPPIDSCLVGKWQMTDNSVAEFISGKPDGAVSGKVITTFNEDGTFSKLFASTRWSKVYLTSRGKFKNESAKHYQGIMRGCAWTVESAPRSRDAAIPLRVSNIHDNVNRVFTSVHAGGAASAKNSTGLEKWHWPNTNAYYRCSDTSLFIGRREYTRVGHSP